MNSKKFENNSELPVRSQNRCSLTATKKMTEGNANAIQAKKYAPQPFSAKIKHHYWTMNKDIYI
jgi:hypothetical protein